MSVVESVFNGNDRLRGFNDGKKDAEAGRSPNYVRMGLSLKFAIHGQIALDSYVEGYDMGYNEVLRKSVTQKVEMISTQPPSPSQTSSTPSSVTTATSSQPQSISTASNKATPFNHFFTNPLTSRTMNIQSIEAQLEALHQLEQFLINTIEELHARMQTYNDRVSALRNDGLAVEIADNYDANYCIPNNQKLWQVTEHMEQSDLKYLRDNIQHYEEELEIARRNYNS